MERKNPNVVIPDDLSLIKTELLTEDKAHDIIYLISTYPDVVRDAYKSSQPSTIVTFAFRLAHAISAAWDGRALPRLVVFNGLPADSSFYHSFQFGFRTSSPISPSPVFTSSSALGTLSVQPLSSSLSNLSRACKSGIEALISRGKRES